jgi:hypothetical protein
MKLSIDDLRVDSYAAQLSELELTEVKGGSTWYCVGDAAIAAAAVVYEAFVKAPTHEHTHCDSTVTTTTNRNGTTSRKIDYHCNDKK